MTKPKIRFPEFTEDWKTYKIENVFDRVSKPVNVESNVMYKQIGIRSHGKGIFYKEAVSGDELGNKRVFWIEPDCFVVNIVFAWERAVARTTEKEIGMIASHRFPMYKVKQDVADLEYITEYFKTKYGQQILILASPGGAGRNKTLGQDEFAKSRIKLPSCREQRKIIDFLKEVEDRINIQIDIVADLEAQKKGLMQKLFSQQVRFELEDGSSYPEWEETCIRECLNYEQPTKYIVSSEDYDSKFSVPVLTANKGFILGYTSDSEGIYDKGNVIIYDDFTMDAKYVDFPFKVKSSAIKILTPKGEDNLYFIFSFLQYLNLSQEEHSRSYISKIEPMYISLPCLEEQQKIADCLLTFEKKINVEKAILEDWQQIKKGLFQQMFI